MSVLAVVCQDDNIFLIGDGPSSLKPKIDQIKRSLLLLRRRCLYSTVNCANTILCELALGNCRGAET